MIGGLGAINLIISLGLIIFAPYIIGILFGQEYLNSIFTFRILALAYFVAGTFRIPIGNILATMRKLKFNFCNSLISGALNVFLDIWFVKKWGMEGAAIATLSIIVFSSIISMTYIFYILNNKTSNEE